MRSTSLKEQIADELQGARDHLRRCIESLSDAQGRVELLERMSVTLTDEREEFAKDLLTVGIFESPRPF